MSGIVFYCHTSIYEEYRKQTIEFELNTSYMAAYPKQRTWLNHYDKLGEFKCYARSQLTRNNLEECIQQPTARRKSSENWKGKL